MTSSLTRQSVQAVLGPTNTGKTHLAIERMLGHASGMIGFPLRLLARENYDRVVARKGRGQTALITGEEKIIPSTARYFICTVESMPLDRMVEFLAVDEIQLAADPERGHAFTHRLLHARGISETMFLGSETARGLIRALVPDAEFSVRPRLSTLSLGGPKKLSRLPKRSAVIAFSASDVYHLAERLRRQRGGTAVVLGALSPRTRNAQVGLFQSGEVDYLVATDAIGMGLNMDIDHVAFARLSKFDGLRSRRLRVAELAQIAGRAGRHMSDGTFGTVPGALDDDPLTLSPETVDRIETHKFDPLKAFYWRNSDLDFGSISALLRSLQAKPVAGALKRTPEADDQRALAALANDSEIVDRATGRDRVALLWQVCQVPDFRKTLSDAHTRLIARLYSQLLDGNGRLDTDWVAAQLVRLDRIDGDIDTLVGRLAHIRTWTFVAHRGDWLNDPDHWRERTRAIEDSLSDALHERLAQRFVDRRSALLAKHPTGEALGGSVSEDGDVALAGHYIGRLDGFLFSPDKAHLAEDTKVLQRAARQTLRQEVANRLRQIEAAPDDALELTDTARVRWRGADIGVLQAATRALEPRVKPIAGDLLEPAQRDRLEARLQRWWGAHFAAILGSLEGLRAPDLEGAARGIAFQLSENAGKLRRRKVADLIADLKRTDRRALARHGVFLGRYFIYVPKLLKPKAVRLIGLLEWLHRGRPLPAPLPKDGVPSLSPDQAADAGFYLRLGYAPLGPRAVRLDRVEALGRELARLGRDGPFAVAPSLASMIGVKAEDLPAVLQALGFKSKSEEDGSEVYSRQRARPSRRRPRRRSGLSPFDKLKLLESGQ
ncbi:MAG: helicase-related protein [Pseudomonadota bacterium]